MKLKCISKDREPELTIGKKYIVYEGQFNLNGKMKEYIMFKIENDCGSVIPYDSKHFTIISHNNNCYINDNAREDSYKFNHRAIAYKEFWSMFYDEAGSSIEDFRAAKKELFKSELSKEEVLIKLSDDNIDEIELIIELLKEEDNSYFMEDIISICKKQLDKWEFNNELCILFEYLSEFKNEEVNQFFICYLSENQKGNENLDKIVYKYFQN